MGGLCVSTNDSHTFSVIIGKVSTEDRQRIIDSLKALRRQQGDFSYEVIVADRQNDDVSRTIQQMFPEVKLLPYSADTTLPALRAYAARRATGEILVVTEDHCIPSDNWLAEIAEAFEQAPPATVAIGGSIANGLPLSNLDWATFLCEYSYFISPVPTGITRVLPGMNIAYKSTVFDNIDEKLLISGFWETLLHPVLLEHGHTFFSRDAIVVYHSKHFSLRLFCSQRFSYSRHYAGSRFRRNQVAFRLLAACLSPLLPILVLYRIFRNIRAKRRFFREFTLALPYLMLFAVVWALGEFWGYLFGAGTALVTIE
jgi:glycosyl transferase family 2